MSREGLKASKDAELFENSGGPGQLLPGRLARMPFRVAIRPALLPSASVSAQELAELDFLVLEKRRNDDGVQVLEEIRRLRTLNRRATLLLVVHGGSCSARLDYLRAGADVVIRGGHQSEAEIAALLARLHENARGFGHRMTLDTLHLRLVSPRNSVELSYSEMVVLRELSRDDAHVLSYDQLAIIFGMNSRYYDRSALSKSMSRLRTKIHSVFGINLIESIRGYGYRLNRGLVDVQ